MNTKLLQLVSNHWNVSQVRNGQSSLKRNWTRRSKVSAPKISLERQPFKVLGTSKITPYHILTRL